MQQPNYKDVIVGFIFSMHSRRFALSLVTMFIMYQGGRAGLSNEVLAIIGGVASSFILGESYNDGKKSEAAKTVPDTVTAGGDVSVGKAEPTKTQTGSGTEYIFELKSSSAGRGVDLTDGLQINDIGADDSEARALQAQAVIEQEAQNG